MGIGLAERSIRAHNLLEYIDKREDCVTVLCGHKISLYTGRPSGQRTEDCPPPEPVLGDSVMSGRLLISGHLLISHVRTPPHLRTPPYSDKLGRRVIGEVILV